MLALTLVAPMVVVFRGGTAQAAKATGQLYEAGTYSLAMLKEQFPKGRYWNHKGVANYNAFTTTTKPCSNHDACNDCQYGTNLGWGKQCEGFGKLLGYLVTGSNPGTSLDGSGANGGWTVYSDKKNKLKDAQDYVRNSLKAGDILQVGRHTVFVTNVEGETVTYAATVKVSGGANITAQSFNVSFTVVPIPPQGGLTFNKGADYMYQIATECASSPITVEAWVKLPKSLANSTRGGVILGNWYDKASSDKKSVFNFEIYTNGNPRIYWDYTDAGGARQLFDKVFTNIDVRQDRYVHVAIVMDAANKTLTCYIDGQEKQKITNVIAPTTVAKAQPYSAYAIGNDHRANGSIYFRGSLADVRVWSGIRSAGDIMAGMYEPAATANLMGRWKLWDKDSSGEAKQKFIFWIIPTTK